MANLAIDRSRAILLAMDFQEDIVAKVEGVLKPILPSFATVTSSGEFLGP